ncbi:MAG: hypothetical protein U0324_38475 [Polyangiales bacterium]
MTLSMHRASCAFIFALLGCASNPMGAAPDATPDVAPDVAAPDVAPDAPPPTCTPGARCGNDCLPQDAPCWACGSLTYDNQCRCVASGGACAPATGCDNPAPAGVGEFCGTYRWCNRACADGLTCTGTPPGSDGGLDYRHVCERARDAGADAEDAGEPTFQLPAPDGGSTACGTLTCAPNQICVLGCSGIDAGPVDLHRCAPRAETLCADGRCPCRVVCGSQHCTQEASGVVVCTLCA